MNTPDPIHAVIVAVQTAGPCLDCPADLTTTQLLPGVWRLEVAHEPTCPTYRALKLSGRAS